jgi:lysozyme
MKAEEMQLAARQINKSGLNLIREFEGLRLSSYRCAAKRWTIGYGHTATAEPGQTITAREANDLLAGDLLMFEKGVTAAVKVPLTDNQFAALVAFAFNVGLAAFGRSTLLRHLNTKRYAMAAEEFLRWNKVNGEELGGLTRRRTAERALFLKQD